MCKASSKLNAVWKNLALEWRKAMEGTPKNSFLVLEDDIKTFVIAPSLDPAEQILYAGFMSDGKTRIPHASLKKKSAASGYSEAEFMRARACRKIVAASIGSKWIRLKNHMYPKEEIALSAEAQACATASCLGECLGFMLYFLATLLLSHTQTHSHTPRPEIGTKLIEAAGASDEEEEGDDSLSLCTDASEGEEGGSKRRRSGRHTPATSDAEGGAGEPRRSLMASAINEGERTLTLSGGKAATSEEYKAIQLAARIAKKNAQESSMLHVRMKAAVATMRATTASIATETALALADDMDDTHVFAPRALLTSVLQHTTAINSIFDESGELSANPVA